MNSFSEALHYMPYIWLNLLLLWEIIVRTLHYFFNLWVMTQLSIWLQMFHLTSWSPIKSYFWWPPKTHFLNSSCCTVLSLNKNYINLNPFIPRLWVMTKHSIWLPMIPMVPSFSKCLWFSWTPKTASSTSSCMVCPIFNHYSIRSVNYYVLF